MEILAPAGNREALERAQAAGADAVYLGYAAFSARAGAGNFDDEELADALRFAHLHRMRVYVTVNTLVKDGELAEVEKLLTRLEALQVDGVLVQDFGILRMIRKNHPGLRVHASTQMAIHNASGVRWCARMGMKRVVLARECSLDEIRQCAETGMEIEVFGHGAQCVSVSGECLFSSMVGERSGNRGRCAQPCRKIYRLDGRIGAWLSPRDLCLRDEVPALAEAGAASLKIEGRLKRPEYVYTVTDSYRRALDTWREGRFEPADDAETEALQQMFHRGGFMRGYAFGAEDAAVIQPESVNHRGIRIGTTERVRGRICEVRTTRDLHDGDGLRLNHDGTETEMTYAGPEVPAGSPALIRLREGIRAAAGDPVYRLTDTRQLETAMAAPLRRIPAAMEMEAWPGKPLRLRVTDGEKTAEVFGAPVEAARTRESTAEELQKQLEKTGGTDFRAERITVRTGGAFVPVSAVNSLRREALEKLAEARIDGFAYPAEAGSDDGTGSTETNQNGDRPGLFAGGRIRAMVIARNQEQAEAARRQDVRIAWYPEDFREAALETLAGDMQAGDWIRLPEVCEEATLATLREFFGKQKEKLGGVLLGSIGQLGVTWPVPVAAGPGVPVMNREAARLLKEQGCAFVFASPELTGGEARALRQEAEDAPDLPEILAPVYGRAQLMLLHHCPARTAMGLQQGHRECRMCDTGAAEALRGKSLEDEEGRRFPMLRERMPEGCLVRLMNMLPTDLGDKGVPGPVAMEMTTESGEATREIVDCILNGERGPEEATRGHWKRPVL